MGVSEGEVLAGKYRVERVLGQGGMGVVVAAQHLVLDQAVAIKFLLPETLGNAEAVARFEREARAAVRIQSEHVARVTDVGRLDTGAPYMVMELLRGRDLGDLLQKNGPLPVEDVTDYVLQAGEAIAEAHGLGIVHRDLKPPNLFLTTRADGSSCVKVLDFGISKVTGSGAASDHALTSTTAVMGSPLYMSPEQLFSARDVDMRTDIWSLGIICYELLTGHPPFTAEALPQLCMAISAAPPTPLRAYRPDLPVELERVLFRCLEKDRDRRYANMSELASELMRFAPTRARLSVDRIERLARTAGFSASAPQSAFAGQAPPFALAGQAAAVTHPAAGTVAEFGRTRPAAPASKRPVALLIAAVALAAALAAGAVVTVQLRRSAPDAEAHAGPSSPPPTMPATAQGVAANPSAPEVQPTVATPAAQTAVAPQPASPSPEPEAGSTDAKGRPVKLAQGSGAKSASVSKLANGGKAPSSSSAVAPTAKPPLTAAVAATVAAPASTPPSRSRL